MGATKGAALLKQAKLGDMTAFAKLLTWLERSPTRDVFGLTELLEPASLAFRFGITGPPGAGKSTLVGKLLTELRDRKLKIGVIAVDPSSPFSRGAILGDRIRYSEHFLDPGIFIRSLGSRGSLGGLSAAAFLMARAFDACGFDLVLIETVGVGQTELDILHVADQVCVVLVPESGDSIQAMKAGLMEIADLFVINKSDRPGAAGLAREIESSTQRPVFRCTASEGTGVAEVATVLMQMRQSLSLQEVRARPARLQEEARALLRAQWETETVSVLKKIKSCEDLAALFI